MSQSPIFARLLWKDAWILWPLTLALCGIAVMLYLLVPLLPGNQSAAYSAWLLLFPNLFALGAPQLQVGQEEESKTFYWARSLPIPWRTAIASNLLTATIGLVTVWVVCGIATYIAYMNGGFRPDSSFASVGTWPAELYRVITFSWMLLGLGYLCSWYFRSPLVALIAVVPTAFLSVGLTHLISGWVDQAFLSESSLAAFRGEILFIGHVNIALAIVYGAIATWLARRRWIRPESERGFSRRSAASPAYRPAPLLTYSRPAPTISLLWQAARQSSVAILTVSAVLFLCLIAIIMNRPYSFSNGFMTLVTGMALFSVGILGEVAFGGDHARDRHRFLAEIGLNRWQVWWTRLLIPFVVVVTAIVALWASFLLFSGVQYSSEMHLVTMIGMAAFGISQLTGMWIRRPAVAIGSAMMLFLMAIALGTIYEFYENFVWTGWIAIFALFLASLSMCRRWMDRDRGPAYHAGVAGWLGVAAISVFLPIIAVRWWTTPSAMPEWRERTLATAAVVDTQQIHPIVSYVNLRYRPNMPHSVSDDLEQLQEAFADAADEDRSFPVGRDLASKIGGFLHMARSQHVSEAGRVDAAFARYLFDMDSMGGVEKWYDDLLSFALDSVDRLPELRYELLDADQADHYEQIVAAELERPESRELLGEERWREFVGRLRTAEQREEDRRKSLLASYRQFAPRQADAYLLIGGYSPWGIRAQHLPWERARSRRWIDVATRISLEQLAAGVPREGSEVERERMQAWAEALDSPIYSQQLPTRRWTADLDQRVEALRERAK